MVPISSSLLWVDLERVRPAGTCLLSFPRCGWESGSCLDLPLIILLPQEVHTCWPIFQIQGIWAGSAKNNGKKVKFLWGMPLLPFPHTTLPSSFGLTAFRTSGSLFYAIGKVVQNSHSSQIFICILSVEPRKNVHRKNDILMEKFQAPRLIERVVMWTLKSLK